MTGAEAGDEPSRRASQVCRRAENAFYEGDFEAAINDARAAFALTSEAPDIQDFCAWLFSNCGRHADAAAIYDRMLERRPGWAEGHRHASGSYAACGEIEAALFHAQRACDLDPDSIEFALHAGGLCEQAGRSEDAADYFGLASAIQPRDPRPWRHLSSLALAEGEPEAAVDLALRALRLGPDDPANAVHAAELLLRSGRVDEAAGIALAYPEDAALQRLLSSAEMLRGRLDEALAAVDRAIGLAPDRGEYHLHRGSLLHRMGQLEAAAEAFDEALLRDPQDPEAKRAKLALCLDAGQLLDAVALGGGLIHAAPDNADYGRAALHALNRRFDVLDGDYVVLGERELRRRRPHRAPGFAERLRTQGRVIYALVLRETRTRFGDHRLGYGWALLEPMLHILMLSLVFAALMHGRPPIGTQFFIFYYTGIIPYHVFVHTSSNLAYAITANGSLLQLPSVTTFDVILARGLLELATDAVVAVLLLAGFSLLGWHVLPDNAATAGLAVLAVWAFACGCGYINAVLNVLCKSWDKIWVQLVRLLYFASGIFYVPGMMPDWVRDILAWNPVLQAVDWVRSGFYAEYAPHWLDRGYLVTVALVALVAGLGLERGLRRKLYEPS